MDQPLLQSAQAMDDLTQKLESCPSVAREGPDEAPTLVHALSDIEESCRRYLGEQLPKLVDAATAGRELEDVLIDILEEFRHIAYHIHDPEYFRAIEPTHDWITVTGKPPET